MSENDSCSLILHWPISDSNCSFKSHAKSQSPLVPQTGDESLLVETEKGREDGASLIWRIPMLPGRILVS